MEIFTLVFAAAFGLVLVVVNILLWLKVRRFDNLVKGPDDDKSSKLLLQNVSSALQKLDKDIQEMYEINSKISKITNRGVCKIGLTRFNALGEKNGNQSFAIALLNYKDSGLIISNIQTSQGARQYVRQIRNGEEVNGTQLLSEEKKSLERARQVVF